MLPNVTSHECYNYPCSHVWV